VSEVCDTNEGGHVKARGNKVKASLEVIERAASERGLNGDDITSLVIAATSNKLRQSHCNTSSCSTYILQ